MPLTDPDGDHPAVAQAKTARRKQARPSELVAAALDLFVEKGFAATRAEEVANLAALAKHDAKLAGVGILERKV